jgi:carboxypeptidase C (cathepsin A)
LSFTKRGNYCKNDFEVNRDFHYFLEEFFLFHSDKFLNHIEPTDDSPATSVVRRPFYFSGESHAGHYIPSMMDFILKRNDGVLVPDSSNRLQTIRVKMPLSGAAIGNGWTDPYYQYSAADAAFGAGIIGISQRASLEAKEKTCQSKLKSGSYDNQVCFELLDTIVAQSHGRNGDTIVSSYDTRLWEQKGQSRSFPMGHKDVETYLGGARSHSTPPLQVDYKQVLAAIHATESIDAKQTYEECTDPPYYALQGQDGLGVVDELVAILDHESRPHMLFFNGMNDLICNHVGNERFLDALPWSRSNNYLMQTRHAWDSGVDSNTKNNYSVGRPDGYIKQHENLSFLKVMESGHMVPMDQPSIALAMIKTLVGGSGLTREGFLSSSQSLDNAKKDTEICALDQCPECKPEMIFENASEVPLENNNFDVNNVGAIVGAFAMGLLIACLYHCKRSKSERSQRELVTNLSGSSDLELSDMDSYSDKVDDAEYT